MNLKAWMLVLVLCIALAGCQKKEEAPLPAPTPPQGMEKAEPTAKETADRAYLSGKEGEKQGMQSLEVVDKNISQATGQPSAIEQTAAPGPETVVYEASMGKVTFPHIAHGQRMECRACHGEGPPAKIILDKESAHKLCRTCHEERGAGPTKCQECHVKS